MVPIADTGGVLVREDVLIRGGLAADGISYDLRRNPVTENETWVLLQPASSPQFDRESTFRNSAIPQSHTGAILQSLGSPPSSYPFTGYWPTGTAYKPARPILSFTELKSILSYAFPEFIRIGSTRVKD